MNQRRLQKALNFLRSSDFLLLLIAGWLLYYVTVSIWSKEAFSRFVNALDYNVAVQFLTLVFLLSFLMYLARTFVRMVHEHGWKAALWVPFSLGLLFLLFGFYMNALFHNIGTIVVSKGDVVAPPWGRESLIVRNIDPGLKNELLDINSPESTIFQYEPMLEMSDQSGKRYRIRGFPPTKIGPTYYHILDFGLAPGIRLSRDGQTVIDFHVIQRLLPPGSTDSFFLRELPYRVEIRIAPTRIIEKGGTKAPVFNLSDLRFTVLIYRGEDLIFEGPSGNGIFFDGMKLEFTSHTYWVRVEAAQRPGMIPLVLGISLIVIGFPLWLGLKMVLLVQRHRREAD